jgi:hypothetical protein
VTELQLWSRKPATFPPHPEAQSPELRAASVRTMLIYLVLAFGLCCSRRARAGRRAGRRCSGWRPSSPPC